MKISLLVLLLVVLPRSSAAADSPPLLLSFAPATGDSLRLTLSETETDTQSTEATGDDPFERLKAASAPQRQTIVAREIGYDWKIRERDTDGNVVVEISYAFVRVATTANREVKISLKQFGALDVVKPGVEFVLDTRVDVASSNPHLEELKNQPADQQPAGLAALLTSLESAQLILNRSLIGRPFTLIISPQGSLLAVHGLELLMDEYRNEMSQHPVEPQVRAQQDALIEAYFGEDTVVSTMKLNLLPPYPTTPVGPGDSWSDEVGFDVSGRKMVVTRAMQLAEGPADEGQVILSGTGEVEFKQDGMQIEMKRSTLNLSAAVDQKTGLYRRWVTDGHIEFVDHPSGQATEPGPAVHLDRHLVSTAEITRFASQEPAGDFQLFEGDGGAYQLRLGPTWSQKAPTSTIGGLRFTVYEQASTDTQLTVSIGAPPQGAVTQAADAAAAMKTDLESSSSGSHVSVVWSREFDAGSVHWLRFHLEIKDPDGQQRSYWQQAGSTASGHYQFEVMRFGVSNKEFDAEVDGILDRIVLGDH